MTHAPPLLYYLSATTPLVPDGPPADLPTELNGQPVAYFWADAIRTGRYVHPLGRFELSVDRRRLDTWAANFHRMRGAGIDVPVPVDHSSRARDNLGYVVDARRDGDRLLLLHQLIGDDAIKLAARNKVSLGIDPAFRTGTGEPIGDCIVHSALTPVPVVPGQGGLLPMSREPGDADDVPAPALPIVFQLSTEDDSLHDRHATLLARHVDHLARAGHITPACRDRLQHLFRARDHPSDGTGGADPAVIHLSRAADFDAVDALLTAFEHNRALVFAERTGIQTLARVVPGDDAGVDTALQSRMVRMANGR